MSLHRFAARRDDNEPLIRATFMLHGWHTEQVSGAGMPDLLCFPPRRAQTTLRQEMQVQHALMLLVDVKTPEGRVTKPQEKKWAELAAKGIPVYVARTAEDVDAIVSGDAEPWTSEALAHALLLGSVSGEKKAKRGMAVPSRDATRPARHPSSRRGRCGKSGCRLLIPCAMHGYTPPRTAPIGAPSLAAETFAPPSPLCIVPHCFNVLPCPHHPAQSLVCRCGSQIRAMDGGLCKDCALERFAPPPIPCSRHEVGPCSCLPCQRPGCMHNGPCPERAV